MPTLRLTRKTIWILSFTGTLVYTTFWLQEFVEDFNRGATAVQIAAQALMAFGGIPLALLLGYAAIRAKEASEPMRLDSEKLDAQFMSWGLSPAEKEIAHLILQGFSNSEIARMRETSRHTIKQQASAVYRKSGCKNRSEMSAFFLRL